MRNIGLVSAVIYTSVSLIAAAAFAFAATLRGYGAVERLGGAFWVFLLSMIILMPVVIPFVKSRMKPPSSTAGS
jgi:hypothetical protein